MTYMEMTGQFSLKDFAKEANTHSSDNLYKKLEDFLIKVRQYENIDALIDNHISHNRGKNDDKKSKKKLKTLQDQYNIEATQMIHIHTNTGGNGKFVLHGFRLKNNFEIVWLDPFHKLHKT